MKSDACSTHGAVDAGGATGAGVAGADTGDAGASIPNGVWFDLLVMLIMWWWKGMDDIGISKQKHTKCQGRGGTGLAGLRPSSERGPFSCVEREDLVLCSAIPCHA